MAHEHKWIDITTVESGREQRKCVTCGLEQSREFIGIGEGPKLDNDELIGWEDCEPLW